MRIVRFAGGGGTGWGFLEDDEIFVADPAHGVEESVATGLDGLHDLRRTCTRAVALRDARLLAPLARPSKIVGLARNYRDHPPRGDTPDPMPLLFGIPPSSIIGPDDQIEIPAIAKNIDWEVELGIVIGPRARNVRYDVALDHVIGYTVVNDVSARDPEITGGQLFRGKAFDTFKPMGPCIVTVDELSDAADLSLRLLVNGEVKQDSTTANLIHGVRKLIEFCSETFTLEPGDVIASGTPGGVGASRKPPEFLKHGDEVIAEIAGIGSLRNTVRDAGAQ